MLTKQHQLTTYMMEPGQKQVYKTHLCGLCHAPGRHYGLPYRLLANREMVFLSMLISAQCQEPPQLVWQRCPLNPWGKVLLSQHQAGKFTAAVAVELASSAILAGLYPGQFSLALCRPAPENDSDP